MNKMIGIFLRNLFLITKKIIEYEIFDDKNDFEINFQLIILVPSSTVENLFDVIIMIMMIMIIIIIFLFFIIIYYYYYYYYILKRFLQITGRW